MGLFHKNEAVQIPENAVLSPSTGRIIPISEVKDPVFAEKVLGDGAAIIPMKNQVVAPVSGTVVKIADTLHAVCLEGDNGLEILIHLGIDTVKLNGKGFVCHVENGQHVNAGDPLIDMDVAAVRAGGFDPVTPCVITNMDYVKKLTFASGTAAAGETVLMKFFKNN